MKVMKNKQYRPGEVPMAMAREIPGPARKQPEPQGLILAYGEVMGDRLSLETTDPVDRWKRDPSSSTVGTPTSGGAICFLPCPSGHRSPHPGYDNLEIPAGCQRISRQREYAPASLKPVVDRFGRL